jgi:hypothetical protein
MVYGSLHEEILLIIIVLRFHTSLAAEQEVHDNEMLPMHGREL